MQSISIYIIIFSFILSVALIFFALYKFRRLGLIEVLVIFSWFPLFFRTSLIEKCKSFINRDVYYWNETYYHYGIVIGSVLLILFQIGSLIGKRHPKRLFHNVDADKLISKLKEVVQVVNLATLVLFFVAALVFGQALLPWTRVGGGAISNTVQGFGMFYQIISLVGTMSIVLNLFLFLEKRERTYLYFAILIILFFLLIGRRGRIVYPILIFLFYYSYYVFSLRGHRISGKLNAKYVLPILLIFFIIFNGKDFALNFFSGAEKKTGHDVPFACRVVKSGHQEFDLLWPAIITQQEDIQFYDIPLAMFGGFVPHRDRLDNYPELYSMTDKLMMSTNSTAYYSLKFGASPNVFQFYYGYFGVLSFLILFVLGCWMRHFESLSLGFYFNGKIFKSFFVVIGFQFFTSAFDFFGKYFVAQTFILVGLFVLLGSLKYLRRANH